MVAARSKTYSTISFTAAQTSASAYGASNIRGGSSAPMMKPISTSRLNRLNFSEGSAQGMTVETSRDEGFFVADRSSADLLKGRPENQQFRHRTVGLHGQRHQSQRTGHGVASGSFRFLQPSGASAECGSEMSRTVRRGDTWNLAQPAHLQPAGVQVVSGLVRAARR